MISARRLGGGLMAFGAAGLVLVAAATVLLLATIDSIEDVASGFAGQRDRVEELLTPASQALTRAADSAEHASTSLASTSTAARDAASLMDQLGGAFDQMASLSQLQVLGARPFAQAAQSFADTAARARTLSTQLTASADAMTTNVTDSAAVAEDLRSLATQLDQIRDAIGTTTGPSGEAGTFIAFRVVLLGLLAWFAIAAGGILWLGSRIRRRAAFARPL